MGPFAFVEHFPTLLSVSSSTNTTTQQQDQSYNSNNRKASLQQPPPSPQQEQHISRYSSSEQTTIVSLSEESASSYSAEENNVEVIHHHSYNNSEGSLSSIISIDFLNHNNNIMALQLDRYGFITNIDSKGQVVIGTYHGDESIKVPTFAEAQRIERREKKWNTALSTWDNKKYPINTNNNNAATAATEPKQQQQQQSPEKRGGRKQQQQQQQSQSQQQNQAPIPNKVLIRRLRKGIPDSVRGRVWVALGGGVRKPGLYQEIVHKTSDAMLETYREMRELNHSASNQDPLGLVVVDADNKQQHGNGKNGTSTSNKTSSERSNTSPGKKTKSTTTVKTSAKESISSSDSEDFATTRNFRSIQDTIERDIHRTYPRHNLFYEEDRHKQTAALVVAVVKQTTTTTTIQKLQLVSSLVDCVILS